MSDYRGSDGRCYGDRDVWERLEQGEWSVCCWDEETGLEVVETDDNDLLFLVPKDRKEVEAFAVET
ncbi:hypothetical protein [Halorarius litoreus]|uniref:hypothetical protein n=1 Tax=Halorarius litoreus TaxID=2962676 RepID=UPI0020CBDEBE|nr:hypothetical protein [Halorarius litoreus]